MLINMQMLEHIGLLFTEIEVAYFDSFGVEHVPEKIK